MKLTEQQEARRMRRDEGLSLNEIAACLQVSKSSASLWVRDIVLTEPQVAQLTAQNQMVAFFVRFLEHCYCVQKHVILRRNASAN